MDGPVPVFRLSERGGDGVCCDWRGVALGPVALIEAAEARSRRVYRLRSAEDIARTLALAYGAFTGDDFARRLSGLNVAALALEAGDIAKAMVAALQMKLPPLPPEAMAKLAAEPTLKKDTAPSSLSKANPYHKPAHSPGGTGGRFTSAEGAASGDIEPRLMANRNEKPRKKPAKTGTTLHPWMRRQNQDFRNYVARAESSTISRPQTDGYDDKSKDGKALGRYQLRKDGALLQIGWVDRQGNWTSKAAEYGVTSDADFLSKRDAQEAAFDLFLRDAERQARGSKVKIKRDVGTEQEVSLWDLAQQGRTYTDEAGRTTKITMAGIVAASHRQGAAATAKFLTRVAANGWTTKGLDGYSPKEQSIAQRLLDAQNVPYARQRG
jgi:hypothetical protein